MSNAILAPVKTRQAKRLSLLGALRGAIAMQQIGLAMQPMHGEFFAALQTSTEIQAEMVALRERAQAIAQLVASEERDLSDEEQAEVDEILGNPAENKPGKLAKLEKQLARAKQIEANQAALALERASAQSGSRNHSEGNPEPNLDGPRNRIIVPARCITGKPMKAFKGPDAKENAYAAGHFYLAALFGVEKSRDFCKANGMPLIHAQSGGVDGKGGFLVPTELANTIIQLAFQYGVVMEFADVHTMISDTKDVVKEAGDPTAQWMGATGAASERAAVPALDFDYTNHRLVANKMGALVRMTSEITEDAIIDIAENVTIRLARAMAKRMDMTGFLGTGDAANGGFTGILPALQAGSTYTAPAGVVRYDLFTKAHFDAIIAQVDELADDENCAWFVNKRFYNRAMAPIMEAMGGNNAIDLAEGLARKRRMFLGYPVVLCSVFPRSMGTLASTWVGGFGDLSASLIAGVRRDVQIRLSEEAGFTTDEVLLRALFRGAIQAHSIGDATDPGCFIGIRTPAS